MENVFPSSAEDDMRGRQSEFCQISPVAVAEGVLCHKDFEDIQDTRLRF